MNEKKRGTYVKLLKKLGKERADEILSKIEEATLKPGGKEV